jgi:hypothetical protein
MTHEQLTEILNNHKLWLDDLGGQKADLSYADLSEADLSGACLYGADLRRANLREADLREADLRDANLSDANLSEADLSGACMYGADLRRASLYRAKGILQFGPMPTSGRMIYFNRHESAIMVQAGCFWGTIDQLEQAVKSKHNCPMYLAIIALVREQWTTINNQ